MKAIQKLKNYILLIIINCFLILPVNVFANSYIDDASFYTVRFRVTVDHPFIEDNAEEEVIKSWTGAGFVVDKTKGLIVTNAHVSGVGNTFIKTAFKGGEFKKSKLIYVDPELDLALIKIDPNLIPSEATEGKLSCDKTIKNGIAVAAYGHPKGLLFSASRGIISKQRFLYGKEVIQTDAAINSGNSGGPLIDLKTGLIVGINKSTIKKSTGIGLAVPSYFLCRIIELYKSNKNPLPMEVPIKFAQDNEKEEHNKVSEFHYNGKILEIGSNLIKVNDLVIKTPADMSYILRGIEGKTKLTFKNKNNEKSYFINLKRKKNSLDRSYINLAGAVISHDNIETISKIRRPFYIHSIVEGSEADIYGIWKDCWIKSVNSIIPKSLEEIYLLTKDKNEIDVITSCYTSRKGFLTLDYFVRLEVEKNKIEYINP